MTGWLGCCRGGLAPNKRVNPTVGAVAGLAKVTRPATGPPAGYAQRSAASEIDGFHERMSDQSTHDPRTSYDAVADDYASRIAAELQHKPFDRQLLDQFAEQVRNLGWVADIGCGPGHVARYLHDRGVRVVGIDLSPRMVGCARKLHPTIEFQQADMAALPVPNETWGGIVAFYSLIHVPRDHVLATLREFRRALRPRGLLLLAFHIGADVVHLDEWWGHRVSVDFVFFRSDEVERYLTAAGFELERATEREPYPPEVEHQSRRGYVLARAAATRDAV